MEQQITSDEPKRVFVIAVDNSEHSNYAIDFYCKNVRTEGDKVVLVYVPQMYSMKDASPGVIEELLFKMKGEMDEMRGNYRRVIEEKGINGEFEIAIGPVAEQIIAVAEKHNASSILIGAKGKGKWTRVILGSVSDSVIHHSPVPVMVTHLPQK